MRGRKPSFFLRIQGERAFARLCSMLKDSVLDYATIGRQFGISRQRVGQIAEQLGIKGRNRQRERTLGTVWFRDNGGYPAIVRAVAREIERCGMKVEPYIRQRGRVALTRKRTLLVEGVPCRIYSRRRPRKTTPTRREYVQFRLAPNVKEAGVAVFAFWRGGKIKLYVVPTHDLKKVSIVWLPADGRYAQNHNIKPKRDWTVYEEAWHLLKAEAIRRSDGKLQVKQEGQV